MKKMICQSLALMLLPAAFYGQVVADDASESVKEKAKSSIALYVDKYHLSNGTRSCGFEYVEAKQVGEITPFLIRFEVQSCPEMIGVMSAAFNGSIADKEGRYFPVNRINLLDKLTDEQSVRLKQDANKEQDSPDYLSDEGIICAIQKGKLVNLGSYASGSRDKYGQVAFSFLPHADESVRTWIMMSRASDQHCGDWETNYKTGDQPDDIRIYQHYDEPRPVQDEPVTINVPVVAGERFSLDFTLFSTGGESEVRFRPQAIIHKMGIDVSPEGIIKLYNEEDGQMPIQNITLNNGVLSFQVPVTTAFIKVVRGMLDMETGASEFWYIDVASEYQKQQPGKGGSSDAAKADNSRQGYDAEVYEYDGVLRFVDDDQMNMPAYMESVMKNRLLLRKLPKPNDEDWAFLDFGARDEDAVENNASSEQAGGSADVSNETAALSDPGVIDHNNDNNNTAGDGHEEIIDEMPLVPVSAIIDSSYGLDHSAGNQTAEKYGQARELMNNPSGAAMQAAEHATVAGKLPEKRGYPDRAVLPAVDR